MDTDGHRVKKRDVKDRVEMPAEQNEWLAANREAVSAKIRRGLDELERGEGIPEDELDGYLARLRAERE